MYSWIAGAFFIFLSAFLYWWLEKRKFDRCGYLGIERFNNFYHKIYTFFIDKIIWWSCIISFFMTLLIMLDMEPHQLIEMALIYSIINDLFNDKRKA